jgi:hypothetical protein
MLYPEDETEIVVFEAGTRLDHSIRRLTSSEDPVAVFATPPRGLPASLAHLRDLLKRFLPANRFVEAPVSKLLPATYEVLVDTAPPTKKGNPFYLVGEAVKYLSTHVLGGTVLQPLAVLRATASNLRPQSRGESRKKAFHGATAVEQRLIVQVSDLCTALLLHQERSNNNPLNILWIENRPDQALADALRLYEPAGEPQSLYQLASRMAVWLGAPEKARILLLRRKFSAFHSAVLLAEGKEAPKLVQFGVESVASGDISQLDLGDIHLFLIDIYLDETQAEAAEAPSVDGIAIQNALDRLYPGTPAVIVSSSEDYEETRRVFRNRGEYFLPKCQFLSAPLLYYRSVDELGQVLAQIENPDLRAHVVSLVRRWSREPAYLWFGDKCYHMIDHALPHALDDWTLFNEFEAVLRRNGWLKLTGDEIYIITLAVWLHDIGHKGNERFGEPHHVRDGHGIFSAEYILKRPRLLDIRESLSFSQDAPPFDRYYETAPWIEGRVAEAILKRPRTDGISTLEMAALFALYHKSNAPVVDDQLRDRKFPAEYLCSDGGYVSFEAILKRAYGDRDTRVGRFLQLAYLFRLVDGLNVSKARVGHEVSRTLKNDVIQQDLLQTYGRLKRYVASMIQRNFSEADIGKQAWLSNVLFDDVLRKIDNRIEPAPKEILEGLNLEPAREDEYRALVDFASFISVQDGHFDLHGSVDLLLVGEDESGERLLLRNQLNRGFVWLHQRTVKEKGGISMSIWEKLFGDPAASMPKLRLPYAIAEFQDGKIHLQDLLRLQRGVVLELDMPGDETDFRGLSNGVSELPHTSVAWIPDRPGWIRVRRLCTVI